MRFEHAVVVDADTCIGCGLCERDCPAAALAVENKKARVVARDCIKCGHCVAICPQASVWMTGFEEEPRAFDAPTTVEARRLEDALRTRRSIRRFAERAIEPDVIERIVEAGRLTPTGGNAQNVSYVVLRDAGKDDAEALAVRLFRRVLPLAKLVSPMARRTDVDDRFFFKGAPAAIAVVAGNQVDGALAAANMALMAEAHGLGVLYSGFFSTAANRSRALRRLLGLARGRKVVATLVVGHPAVRYRRTAPKEPADVRIL